MIIVVGGDHAGYPLKSKIVNVIKNMDYEVIDCGCFDETPIDFPDITREVCDKILSGEAEKAVLVCGTGVGACIAANKIPGIRAAVCHDVHSAHQCVEHDDVNVMCIGAQIVGPWLAGDLVASFLNAEFSTDEDCRRRVEKLKQMENYSRR
ncbi:MULTISPECIES: RpiB/LacA/LacB family sugar-phosphate isomerase [Fictibacillus]|uniref:RpiB/LacA/LacB family sugar-phosphate isomerase n=1 Tax=Fictibacillus terranigra TaxID=3058424 RepID=A0ABT8EAM9_9BACL|nr:RpiB/LacA/LacB family sugar-phosphate isomerase [Fictibacillus sp. CENA-BCM004]MDN4074949.1 RpiB/LacA/LacB family sugar-phosphate isomerase [Fictibacillus sp. CENA-BCM004]